MYCKRCGKFIESGDICPECVTEEVVFGREVKVEQYREKTPSRKTGLERGIVGAALSVFAVIFASIGSAFVGAGGALKAIMGTLTAEIMTIPVLLFLSGAAVMTVFGAVFGTKSVILAFHDKKETGKLPIATMILGFVAIGCAFVAAMLVLFAVVASVLLAAFNFNGVVYYG